MILLFDEKDNPVTFLQHSTAQNYEELRAELCAMPTFQGREFDFLVSVRTGSVVTLERVLEPSYDLQRSSANANVSVYLRFVETLAPATGLSSVSATTTTFSPETLLQQLFSKESEHCDWKLKLDLVNNVEHRRKLLLTAVAMVNTPGGRRLPSLTDTTQLSSYVVVGVDDIKTRVLIGDDRQRAVGVDDDQIACLDDNRLRFVAEYTSPQLQLRMHVVSTTTFGGSKRFCLIEVPQRFDGPYFISKRVGWRGRAT